MKLLALLLAVVLSVAVAWIKPAQPHQIANPPTFEMGLDNPNIAADPKIHPARKCK